jgi:hypothetical protein
MLAICAAKRRGGEVTVERVVQADAPSESTQAEDNADATARHESKEDCSKDLGFEPATLPRLKFKKLKALAMRYVFVAKSCLTANPIKGAQCAERRPGGVLALAVATVGAGWA